MRIVMDGDWELKVRKFLSLWANDTPMGKNVLLKFNETEEWKEKRFYDFDVDVRNFFMKNIAAYGTDGVVAIELVRGANFEIGVNVMDFTEYDDDEVIR